MIKINKQQSNEEDIKKKLAQQLSEKTDMSAREIEEGVDKLIKKSQESLWETEIKPPYRRSVWYETFFKLIQQKTITKYSLDFITLNITSVKSEAYKFKNGLLFLNLINKKGDPTPEIEKLRVTGDAFVKNLAKIIQKAYSDLFNTIFVDQVKPESLVNYMIEKHGYSRPRAEEAVVLFVYFCSKANISISNELLNFRPGIEKGEKPVKRSRKEREKIDSGKEYEYDESFATLKFDDFSFAVKKDLTVIEFARSQVNALLDYLTKKLHQESQ